MPRHTDENKAKFKAFLERLGFSDETSDSEIARYLDTSVTQVSRWRKKGNGWTRPNLDLWQGKFGFNPDNSKGKGGTKPEGSRGEEPGSDAVNSRGGNVQMSVLADPDSVMGAAQEMMETSPKCHEGIYDIEVIGNIYENPELLIPPR